MAEGLALVTQLERALPVAHVWCEGVAGGGAAPHEASARLTRISEVARVRRVERSPHDGSQASDFLNFAQNFSFEARRKWIAC